MIMEKLYTVSATSTGGRNGKVTTSDGILDLELKSPKEMGGPGGATNPEALFAAGYSACFNGALNLAARLKKVRVGETRVKISVTLGKDDRGNFRLGALIEATVPGVDPAKAEELVADAHNICPYSRATRGNIDLEIRAKAE